MRESLQESVKGYISRHRSKKVFRKLVQVMGCAVAFVTTYALILPAITMEKETFCGLEEHTHSPACYQRQVEQRELICDAAAGLHVHSGGCYDADGRVICGMADYLIHRHDDSCRDAEGVLVCTLPERSQHIHDSSCYETGELVPHVHVDACREPVQGELICTQPVSEGHRHTDACYTVTSELLCTKTEGHRHGDACYTTPLVCTASTEPHHHTADCYTSGGLLCTIPEHHTHQGDCFRSVLDCNTVHGHESGCYESRLICQEDHDHTDGCWQSVLICGYGDGGHPHTDSCYRTETVCTIPEGHAHTSACFEQVLGCGKTEGEVHVHTDGCYSTHKQLTCQLEENHTHGDSCYRRDLRCSLAESEGHAHTDDCYRWDSRYICGLEEGQLVEAGPVLVCTEPAAASHTHGSECFTTELVEAEPVCGENHDHTDACYPLSCILLEHTHSDQCFSDPDADVETREYWESTLKNLELTEDWRANVVAIAESQLGYTESARNYTVWEDGSRHGYTRYGAWYGVPRGDWCGMFASFCLHYAGVKGMPYDYGVRPWIEKLSDPELDLYRPAGEYTPVPGDLVFFDWDKDLQSDHVGIVYEILEATEEEPAMLKTIEGNSDNCVQFRTYELDSEKLLGYSMLPENPDMPVYICGLEVHAHTEECTDEDGNLICQRIAHQHEDSCIQEPPVEPVYYCGLEEHTHDESCVDEEGNSICDLAEHTHEDACLVEPPVYYCGLEAHTHTEAECYDAEGNLTCELPEHEHSDACLVEPPVYHCGLEVHAHSESCLDEAGKLSCGLDEHEHDDSCLIRYFCGKTVHVHDEAVCFDADGNLLCEKQVHEHIASCLTEPKLYCTKTEHTHEEGECYDETGNLTCEIPEHTHSEACWRPPMMMAAKPKQYYCGYTEEHTHGDGCYDDAGELTCEKPEHTHTEECTVKPPEYYCGQQEHTHEEACYDASGGLLCELQEHIHTSLCLADLSDLSPEDRMKVEDVIRRIDEIPSADELMNKADELAEAGDEEAEEKWMMDTYQQIALVYHYYSQLEEKLQTRVVNRDKLLELEFVWSRVTLATHHVWLDGTNGGIMSLKGSPNEYRSFQTGETLILPESWTSPPKYHYVLRGWYDIKNHQYYAPGSRVTIGENRVFYADWQAATYDVGVFNADVVETISTNDFITTHVFDYSSIFNMYSSSHTGELNQQSHSETWSVVARGSAHPNGNDSFGLVLRDWDEDGSGKLSYPSNIGSEDHYTFQESITTGLLDFSPSPIELFFTPENSYDPQTGTGIMGVQYLGTGDHLFQFETDPNAEHFGYYYYDSARNAASYNQSAGRFYVYDYLERAKNTDANGSDFLPFNSPYANTNGKSYDTLYQDTEFRQDQLTYQYEDKHTASGYSTGKVGINYWFGMSTNIRFYLPTKPGTSDETGYGNRTIYGDEMIFSFSGDDDVWVMVDNQLVLDIGGIHRAKSGTINFSTGTVVVDGVTQTDKSNLIKSLKSGEHNLTLYYTERGSSQSNCHIYFNISPRFTMSLKKEDLLSQTPLKDVTFGVYMDEACTQPAQLWNDHASSKGNPIHTFTTNAQGVGSIWGFAAGNTYYIKEEIAAQGYSPPNGLIKMVLDNRGVAHYSVSVIRNPQITDTTANNPTAGFTAAYSIDVTNQQINLKVTNSLQEGEATKILVQKRWEGSGDTVPVTVYLLADGKRIQERILNADNQWQHTWENLPKFKTVTAEDGTSQKTNIAYTVEEATVPGYTNTITFVSAGEVIQQESWKQLQSFLEGKTVALSTTGGYLAAGDNKLYWTANPNTSAAQWTVEAKSGDTVRLRNQDGYFLREKVSWTGNENYFYTSKDSGTVNFKNDSFYFTRWNQSLYMTTSIRSDGSIKASDSNAAEFTLMEKTVQDFSTESDAFIVTNTPIPEDDQVSLTVTKKWTDRDGQTPYGNAAIYQEIPIPVKLLANGIDSGQSARLTLRNGWTHTFAGLPKENAAGPINYTVVEDWQSEDWTSQYSVSQTGSNTYAAEINNVYSRTVSIPVEKIWGSPMDASVQEDVLVQLYIAAGELQNGTLAAELTLSAQNDWKGTFEVLPLEEIEGNYYIYEPTMLYNAVYSQNTRIFIDGESKAVGLVTLDEETALPLPQTVTNFAREKLPQTGSAGIPLYTAAGLLLTAIALYLLYKKIKWRRKEGPVSS